MTQDEAQQVQDAAMEDLENLENPFELRTDHLQNPTDHHDLFDMDINPSMYHTTRIEPEYQTFEFFPSQHLTLGNATASTSHILALSLEVRPVDSEEPQTWSGIS